MVSGMAMVVLALRLFMELQLGKFHSALIQVLNFICSVGRQVEQLLANYPRTVGQRDALLRLRRVGYNVSVL